MVVLVVAACDEAVAPVTTPDAAIVDVADGADEVGDGEGDREVEGPDVSDGASGEAGSGEVDAGGALGDVVADDVGDVGDALDVDDASEVVVRFCPEVACEPGELCQEGVCVCDPSPVSYARDIAPRFSTGCGPGCHVYNGSVASGSAGLNLAVAFSYQELVGVQAFQCNDARRVRVAPGDVAKSYLIDKMLGRRMCAGVRMPKGRSYWSEADVAMLGRWICQGAKDE